MPRARLTDHLILILGCVIMLGPPAVLLVQGFSMASLSALLTPTAPRPDLWQLLTTSLFIATGVALVKTATPEEGYDLAIKLSRMGVKSTQPDKETLFRERAKYSQDGEALIHASEVIAVHFQTVAAANDYWK